MDELTPLLGAGLNVTIGAPLAAIAAEGVSLSLALLGSPRCPFSLALLTSALRHSRPRNLSTSRSSSSRRAGMLPPSAPPKLDALMRDDGGQGLMGLIVMGSLVLKRAQEEPKRKWKVWLGDVGKQVRRGLQDDGCSAELVNRRGERADA